MEGRKEGIVAEKAEPHAAIAVHIVDIFATLFENEGLETYQTSHRFESWL